MEIIKNSRGLLILIIVSVLVFYLAENKNFFGKIINSIKPCVQNPESSFPCYGSYDVAVMIIAVVAIVACVCILGYRMYRST